MRRVKFRFEDLEIWKSAMDIADKLFQIANRLEEKKLFRFADQLRGAGLSMSNNIAEGSGSVSPKEFGNFLNISRRSTFENANILFVLQMIVASGALRCLSFRWALCALRSADLMLPDR